METLTRQLRVTTRSKSNRVEVTYSSLDPGLAYGVLNSLRNFYLQKHAYGFDIGLLPCCPPRGVGLQGGFGRRRGWFEPIPPDAGPI